MSVWEVLGWIVVGFVGALDLAAIIVILIAGAFTEPGEKRGGN